ncbi:MAG: D-alanyl-D-alanine carboxypeptidase [Oceanospirillaceae bacterium]|nr:D-alanyl-D-alanine carboxypeptidase [Oceanospirillaceae bacterium]
MFARLRHNIRLSGGCVLLMTLLCGPPVAAVSDSSFPLLLLDAGSGRVLHERATDRLWYPASLTKLMTLYLTFEALRAGSLAPDQALKVSPRAAAQPAVKLGLRAGSTIGVQQAVTALATVSSNDVAVVLAEALAGSESAFAVSMTDKARTLGMRDTRFRNASGLPDSDQVTTARDMGILAQRLYRDFPEYAAVFATRSFVYDGVNRSNHNPILGQYDGADGLKTGFTCGSGYNLVATAKRNDRRLVAVVLGAEDRQSRNREARALLDRGFRDSVTGAPSIEERPDRASGPAPVVLGPGVCGTAVASSSSSGAIWPIKSWGVLLGIYGSRNEGGRAIARARSQLGGLPRGRALLLQRDMERGTSWKALLIGYRHDNVGQICLRLRARDIDCVAQPPVVMNLPGYGKR